MVISDIIKELEYYHDIILNGDIDSINTDNLLHIICQTIEELSVKDKELRFERLLNKTRNMQLKDCNDKISQQHKDIKDLETSNSRYLGEYEFVCENYERLMEDYDQLLNKYEAKIDANFSLSVLRSAKCDAIKDLKDAIIANSIPVNRSLDLLINQTIEDYNS